MSASLCPPAPPPSRHRASSTNVRPPLTLATLGRRRSSSLLDAPPPTPSPSLPTPRPKDVPALSLSIPPPRQSQPSRSAFASMLARWAQTLHLSSEQSFPSTPSSPRLSRASTDDSSILPLSASPTRSYFGDVFPEKPLPKTRSSLWEGYPSVHTPVLFVLIMFPLSTAIVALSMSTLPITMAWPRTLPDLAQLGRELHGYSQSGFISTAHVVGVISVVTVWMHSWSIPGSVLSNVLAGALFPPVLAIVLLTFLTTMGSLSASLLAAPLGPFLTQLMPRPLEMTRSALEGDGSKAEKSSPWVRLSILRLVGVVPWSGINIACGVCGVAVWDCFLGALIGSLPWTAVTCQIGDILQTVATNPRPTSQSVQSLLTSPEILMKLAFLSFLSLAPILGRNQLRSWLAGKVPLEQAASTVADDRASRWAWVKEWRSRIRSSSRSRTREASRKELETLVREKESLPM
ncbi:snare associated Golgi protein-domain-containing protein [Cubamyces menziesii]|nr:snare associated Golgi protein-domain-containing protein [Cubamyces menziesii]